MENRVYGYARVSTREQNEDRQLEALIRFGVPEQQIIVDKASGKDTEREGYQYLKRQILRRGDTLVIKELDRLSRNKSDIKRELETFKDMGVRVKILDIPTTLTDFPPEQQWVQEMVTAILIEVLGSIAENERMKIRARQRESGGTFGLVVQPLRCRRTGVRLSRMCGAERYVRLMPCVCLDCRSRVTIASISVYYINSPLTLLIPDPMSHEALAGMPHIPQELLDLSLHNTPDGCPFRACIASSTLKNPDIVLQGTPTSCSILLC